MGLPRASWVEYLRNIAVIFWGFPDSYELCDAMNKGSILCWEEAFLLPPENVRTIPHSGLSLPALFHVFISINSGTDTIAGYFGLSSIGVPSPPALPPPSGGVAVCISLGWSGCPSSIFTEPSWAVSIRYLFSLFLWRANFSGYASVEKILYWFYPSVFWFPPWITITPLWMDLSSLSTTIVSFWAIDSILGTSTWEPWPRF